MAIKIGHASCDENGKYAGGKAGDQTGKEVFIRDWYSRPWNVVIWAEDPVIREKMARSMEQACNNNCIGYDQGTCGNTNDRYSLYQELTKCAFDMSKVSKNVETDCSNLVACCANCANVKISPYIYTGNEKNAFKNAKDEEGKAVSFVIKTDNKYCESPEYNPRGAILLYENHHTAIQLENGKYWNDSTNKPTPVEIKCTGCLKVEGTTSLCVRDYPSADNAKSKIIKVVSKGESVNVVAKANMNGTYWFKTKDNLWLSSKYLVGILTENTCDNKTWLLELGYKYSTNTIKQYENKQYCINSEGWIITPNMMNPDGSLK